MMQKNRMLWYVAVAALALSALVAAPATAATDQRDDIWVGQIVKHHRHFDYRGSACPTSAEICIKVLANYRVVPLNPKAATGLRRAAGRRAKLVGYRAPAANTGHNGVLYVRRAEKA
jgi:hypothetical protein